MENYKIIEAAISDVEGQAEFFVQWPGWSREKSSKEWYGQALAKAPWDGSVSIPVKKISVKNLMEPYKNQVIDLIDMDIQGEEEVILPYLAPFLENIKMLHIGTKKTNSVTHLHVKKIQGSLLGFCQGFWAKYTGMTRSYPL